MAKSDIEIAQEAEERALPIAEVAKKAGLTQEMLIP